MGGKSAAGSVFPLIILTLSYLGTWDEGPGPATQTQSSISPKTHKQIPVCWDLPCVYPPIRLNEQSLAYFVRIASSSLFDESLDA